MLKIILLAPPPDPATAQQLANRRLRILNRLVARGVAISLAFRVASDWTTAPSGLN